MPCFAARNFSILRFMDEFQWFLMALSVLPSEKKSVGLRVLLELPRPEKPHTHRPGSSLAISAQRLPSVTCASRMTRSSASDHDSLLMCGFKWLCHLEIFMYKTEQ